LNKRENDDSPRDSGGYPRRNPVLFVLKIAGAPERGPIYLSERRFSWTNLMIYLRI
jgi:hypothetical protein